MIEALFDEINKYTPGKTGRSKLRDLERKREPIFDKNISNSKWLLFVYLCLVLLVYFIFLGKSVSIQISDRNKYLGLAEQNRIREFSVLPPRGAIYDKDHQVIVRNKPRFSLELNTLICQKEGNFDRCRDSLKEVNKRLEIDDEDRIESELNQKRTNIILATGLSKESILPLEANIDKMPGVSIETAPARDYIYGEAFAHLIGYVGLGETITPEIVGKTGIEEFYNQYLSGTPGKKVVQVNSAGTTYKLINYQEPISGKDVTLFVDLKLQNKAYELLKKAVDESETGATGGAIVAQDPRNGAILALVSYPAFKPDLLSTGISNEELSKLNSDPRFPFFNRAISATYPPGSTFKMVTASAGLMERVITPQTIVFDPGYLQVGSYIFRNWLAGGHGNVNLIRALQVSNDTYFYTVAGGHGDVKGLGIKKLSQWAEKFGLNKKTGIDISGEVSGNMPDGTSRDWYLGDDFISGIGQGDILVTPLQLNNITTFFANGGHLYRPRIVWKIDGVGETKTKVINENFVDSKDYDVIRKGLNAAVEPGGTAYPLFDFPLKHHGIKLAGKTGTSEFTSPEGEEKTHAWFTVFGPYYEEAQRQNNLTEADRPIALTVFLEGGGAGSDDAAPIARDLLDYWFQ